MLVPYDSLIQLPKATVDNLIKEYLLTQVEDGGFSDTDDMALISATNQCKDRLKQGLLIVEYSEDDESIAIRQAEHIKR